MSCKAPRTKEILLEDMLPLLLDHPSYFPERVGWSEFVEKPGRSSKQISRMVFRGGVSTTKSEHKTDVFW